MTNIKEMTDAAKQFMQKLGQWDSVEECFELFLPIPATVSIPFDGDMIDLGLELHGLFEEYDLSYSHTQQVDGVFSMFGIRW